MKVIDLLNKIANGEEVPRKIKCHWEYVYTYDDTREEYAYIQNDGTRFDDDWLVCNVLNNEVEIIEEDKEIEEINFITEHDSFSTIDQYKLQETINKIIRAVNELKKGK